MAEEKIVVNDAEVVTPSDGIPVDEFFKKQDEQEQQSTKKPDKKWVDPRPELNPDDSVPRRAVAVDMLRMATKVKLFGMVSTAALFFSLMFYTLNVWAGMAMFLFSCLMFGYQVYKAYAMEVYYQNKYKLRPVNYFEALR